MNIDLVMPWFSVPDEAMLNELLPSLACIRKIAGNPNESRLNHFRQLPFADLHRLASGQESERHWLYATPIHLEVGIEKILAYPLEPLPDETETKFLMEYLNHHFEADNVHFEYSAGKHWLVRFPEEANIETTPLPMVYGQSIYSLLPRGDKAFWHRLMNEIQMVLFESPINQRRAEQGLQPISSLWLWGNGHIGQISEDGWPVVVTDDVHGLGLARACDAEHMPLDQLTDILVTPFDNSILVYSEYDAQDTRGMQKIEREIFRPILESWKKSRSLGVELSLGEERYLLAPRRFWQVWLRC